MSIYVAFLNNSLINIIGSVSFLSEREIFYACEATELGLGSLRSCPLVAIGFRSRSAITHPPMWSSFIHNSRKREVAFDNADENLVMHH